MVESSSLHSELIEAPAPAPGTNIVIVDDDDLFRESVGQNLVDAGYQIREFENGPSALDFLSDSGDADLILLDWKMPGMNGIEVLRQLRNTNTQVPVIFLTALTDQIYEEAALLSGAVDFVEKSRSFSILLKRIQLILAGLRMGESETGPRPDNSVLVRGALELRLASSRATWRGRHVDLSLTEFKIVHRMASRVGADVRYRDLYDLVHGKDFIAGDGQEGYRANVRTFIKRIRKKFRDVDDGFAQIENYPGFGYRWRDSGDDDS